MKRPYRLVFDLGNPSLEPRTTAYATEEAARRAFADTSPDLQPFAEVRRLTEDGRRSEVVLRGDALGTK